MHTIGNCLKINGSDNQIENHLGCTESYYRRNNHKFEQFAVENTLEIIGSGERIKEVREYIRGDHFGNEAETLLDFNKIINKPEQLVPYCNIDLSGKLVHLLLFGETSRISHNSNSVELMQTRFKSLPGREKQRAFKLALEYQSLIEKYGSMDSNEWCLENWGTEYHAWGEELISDNKLRFVTERRTCHKVIIRLSEIFPMVTFHLTVDKLEIYYRTVFEEDGTSYYLDFYKIENGKCKLFHMNDDGELIPNTFEYYYEIDKKIEKHNCLIIK